MKKIFMFIIFLILFFTNSVFAEPIKAELVVRDSKVLYSSNANKILNPASITKLMTLKIVFEELKKGTISEKDLVVVSQKSTQVAPTKLGLKAGEKISIRDLIGSTAVRSCNDSAYLLAEHVSKGSVSSFVKKMNIEGKKIGDMFFINSSGLPENMNGQKMHNKMSPLSSILLLYSIIVEYPEYAYYLGLDGWKYKDKTLKTTVKFDKKGIYSKTGYTKNSGFNIVLYDSKTRIFVALFGFKTAIERDKRAVEFLNKQF